MDRPRCVLGFRGLAIGVSVTVGTPQSDGARGDAAAIEAWLEAFFGPSFERVAGPAPGPAS